MPPACVPMCKGMSTKVSQHELSRRVGLSRTRLRTLEAEGRISRDADGRYDLEAVQDVLANGIDQERRAAALGTKPNFTDQHRKASLHKAAFTAKLLEVQYRDQMAALVSKAEADQTVKAVAGMLDKLCSDTESRLSPHVNDAGRAVLKRELAEAMRDARKALDDASARNYADLDAAA